MSGTLCLTFDFDAVSLWVQRNMPTATPISRGEFGPVAVPRILNTLSYRNIKSTWFVPGHTAETYPDVCKKIIDEGHEIALHGYMHENVVDLSKDEEWEMFQQSYDILKNLIGTFPKGFRAPAWDLTPNTVGFLENLDLTYDSSLMSQDYSVFYCRKGDVVRDNAALTFGEPSNIVEVPVSWSLDDYPHFEYLRMPNVIMPGLRKVDDVFKNWTDDITYMLRDFEDGVTTATLHPQVIGRGHRMLGLERWLDQLISMGIQFARVDNVVHEFNSGRQYGQYQPQPRN